MGARPPRLPQSSTPVWIVVALSTGLSCGLVAGIGTQLARPSASAWATGVSTAVLASTLVAFIWYSVETLGMRRELIRQNSITIRPLLMTRIEQREDPDRARNFVDKVVVRNIGQWPALFVRIEELVLDGLAER